MANGYLDKTLSWLSNTVLKTYGRLAQSQSSNHPHL